MAVKSESLVRDRIFQFLGNWVGRFWAMALVFLASILLSGCIKYDLGVNFEGVNNGEIVQHVRLEEQLTNFNESQAKSWLNSLEKRTRGLQGKSKRVSDRELTVTIPFNSTKELESKLNEFFNSVEKTNAVTDESVKVPAFASNFKVHQSNFLLFMRNKLTYEVDLRSLGVLSPQGNIILSPDSVPDLDFIVNSPSQPKAIGRATKAATPERSKHQLLWHLKPGEINHVETAFWLPSPLGIGTLIITSIVLGGFYVKNGRLPFTTQKSV